VWLLRGGSLFTSLLVSLPAWSSFDPLPILDSDDDEERKDDDDDSLQALVRKRSVAGGFA
jgi:hypothetical protein